MAEIVETDHDGYIPTEIGLSECSLAEGGLHPDKIGAIREPTHGTGPLEEHLC
jgi:hypothetical protein